MTGLCTGRTSPRVPSTGHGSWFAIGAVRPESWQVGIDAGPLAALLAAPETTDVLVNGGTVWVDSGAGLARNDCDCGGEERVRALAVRLAASVGRRLDAASPFVDARLDGDIRMHAVLPPISREGTCLSLRVLRPRSEPLETLVGSAELAGVLGKLVSARCSLLVTGGTGVGKTTILASLLSQADPGDRILVVEDSSELRLAMPHVVRLESRPPNIEGSGEVTLRELVRQALRMRPDRLVVGEIRGAEIVDVLAALNTGHEGGATTLHANTVSDVPARLEALGSLAGLPAAAISRQAAAGFDAIVHLRRDGSRRSVEAIGVFTFQDGVLGAAPAIVARGGRCAAGPGAARLHRLLADRGHVPW